MGCFEDFIQFRDEVDEAKKKIIVSGATNGREQERSREDESISKLKVKELGLFPSIFRRKT